jgi:hypothetical protein
MGIVVAVGRSMRSIVCLVSLLFAACGNTPGGDDDDGVTPDAPDTLPPGPTDPLHGLPTGMDQWTALCAKGYGDMITAKFCAGNAPPTIRSLVELQTLLGLRVLPNNGNPNVRLTLTGLSTGIGMRTVTPLNPRAFVMTTPNTTAPNPQYQVLAFARGEPFVEMVANDPGAQTLRFFLVRFHPACEQAPGGCNFADLLTPTIESNWTGYTIYDDATIANTTLDCLSCHQPNGPTSQKILRMQELANPWAHWFYVEHASNQRTMMDFHAAHGNEDYAGIPNASIDPSRPVNLQRIVSNNGFALQPNVFDTNKIEAELVNGTSPTWNAMYAKTVAGLEIPTPYFGVPQTDPTKVAPMIQAYLDVMSGALPRDQMPDIRDTLLDSALADMSIRPKAGLDGNGIMVHMCSQCHNSRLDQTLPRARFDVGKLSQMSRMEKDTAIFRLNLPDTDARKMPPPRFHTLSDAERDLVINELSK